MQEVVEHGSPSPATLLGVPTTTAAQTATPTSATQPTDEYPGHAASSGSETPGVWAPSGSSHGSSSGSGPRSSTPDSEPQAASVSAGGGPSGHFVERVVPAMSYRTFYDTFLARYLACYACEPADRAMSLLDMDHSGSISWTELRLRACWALAQAAVAPASPPYSSSLTWCSTCSCCPTCGRAWPRPPPSGD